MGTVRGIPFVGPYERIVRGRRGSRERSLRPGAGARTASQHPARGGARTRATAGRYDAAPPPPGPERGPPSGTRRSLPGRRACNSNHTRLPSAVSSHPHRSATAATMAIPRPLVAASPARRGASGRSRRRSSTSTRTASCSTRTSTSKEVTACTMALVASSLVSKTTTSTSMSSRPASDLRTSERTARALGAIGSKLRRVVIMANGGRLPWLIPPTSPATHGTRELARGRAGARGVDYSRPAFAGGFSSESRRMTPAAGARPSPSTARRCRSPTGATATRSSSVSPVISTSPPVRLWPAPSPPMSTRAPSR
jgi:hypothetical protein